MFLISALYTTLMVVGGNPLSASYKAEFIDLSGESKVCPNVTDFPLTHGSVGTFFDNKAIVCGGEYPNELSNICFSYEVRKNFCL